MSEADRSTLLANLAAKQPQVKVITPDATASATLKTYADQVNAEKAKAIRHGYRIAVPGTCAWVSTNRSSSTSGLRNGQHPGTWQ